MLVTARTCMQCHAPAGAPQAGARCRSQSGRPSVAAPTAQPASSTACPLTTTRCSQGQPSATQPLGWVQASQGPCFQPFHSSTPPPSHSRCREGDTQWSQHQPGVRLLCPRCTPCKATAQGHVCNPTGSAATATFPSYSRGHIGQRDPPRAGNLVAAIGVQQLPRQVPSRHVCPLTHPGQGCLWPGSRHPAHRHA